MTILEIEVTRVEWGQGGFHIGEGSELGSSWRLYAEGKAVIWTES